MSLTVGITSATMEGEWRLPIPCRCGCEYKDVRKPDIHQCQYQHWTWIIQQLENNDVNPCKLNYL